MLPGTRIFFPLLFSWSVLAVRKCYTVLYHSRLIRSLFGAKSVRLHLAVAKSGNNVCRCTYASSDGCKKKTTIVCSSIVRPKDSMQWLMAWFFDWASAISQFAHAGNCSVFHFKKCLDQPLHDQLLLYPSYCSVHLARPALLRCTLYLLSTKF